MAYTLQQLRHLVAVAETGSVSRASEKCHISQPSLSASLKNLADAVSTPLLVRHRNGVSLTGDGERFLRHAQRILQEVERATQDMSQRTGVVSGHLKIGVTETISGYLVPNLVTQVRRRFPELTLEIFEEERLEIERALLDKALDFAILLVSNVGEAKKNISMKTLLKSPRKLWLSVDHPLLGKPAITLRDVAALDFIMLDKDEHVQTAAKYWAANGLTPKVVIQSKSTEAIRSLVAQSFGVTILSDLTYREWSHEGGRIARRDLVDPIPTMDVGLAFRKGETLSPAVLAIADLLSSFVGTKYAESLGA